MNLSPRPPAKEADQVLKKSQEASATLRLRSASITSQILLTCVDTSRKSIESHVQGFFY